MRESSVSMKILQFKIIVEICGLTASAYDKSIFGAMPIYVCVCICLQSVATMTQDRINILTQISINLN